MCFCTLKKALKMCFLWGQAGEGGNVGAGGAPLHRLTAVPLALSGEALLCCNVCYGSPERVELSGGQFDSVKSSLDSWARSALRGCPRRA